MIQYTCPKCGRIGASPENLKPPLCDKCEYEVEMKVSMNGKIIEDEVQESTKGLK